MSTTAILPLKEYNVDTEYTPECNPLDFIYYIPIIDWNRIPVTTRYWYSDTQEVIFISYAIITADLSLKVVCFNVVINRATSSIRIIDAKIWHSANPVGEKIKSVFWGLVGIKS